MAIWTNLRLHIQTRAANWLCLLRPDSGKLPTAAREAE